MRPVSACDACRIRRKKCLRLDLTGKCFQCIKRGVVCTLEESPSTTGTLTLGAPSYEIIHECREGNGFRISPTMFIEYDLARELIDIYFCFVHVAFHNIFHQPSVEAGLDNGTVPKVLLLTIASLSARLSSYPSLEAVPPRERGIPYWKEAEKLINFHSTSLTTIQACIMAAAICIIEGDANTEAVFLGVACRMALIMDLPHAALHTHLDREVYLRVWWSLVATDTWSSSLHQIPKAMPVRPGIRKPMDEVSFANLLPWELAGQRPLPVTPIPSSHPSIFAHMIDLNQLLHKIFVLSSRSFFESSEIAIMEETGHLCAALDDWYDHLPAELQYSPENHSWWAQQGNGRKFTIMHINYNYAGQLLFFRFLYMCQDRPDITPTDPMRSYASRSKAHATQLCKLIQRADETSDCDVRYPLLAHVLVVASIIQLFTLLFSPDEVEISRAKLRLEQNFERLTVLQKYWPNLDASVAKFQTFHLACLEGKLDVFRMDQWLLQFMTDYAGPVTEREKDANYSQGDGTLNNVDF